MNWVLARFQSGFPQTLYIGSFIGAGLLTTAVLPVLRELLRRYGFVDDPGGRKHHAESVPLAGGLAIFVGIVLTLGLGLLFYRGPLLDGSGAELLRYGLQHRGGELTVIVSGALAMLSLGLLDDRCELSPGIKFVGQALIAFLVAAAGVRITLFVPSLIFSYAVTILWIVGLVNAFNFMDNMNGLCGGLAAIATFLFALSSAFRGDYLVAGFGFLSAGAFCGFLPFNYPRATVFLGDSGSHLAGYLVAVLAILPHYYSRKYPHSIAVITPLFVLAIPLFDLVRVAVDRFRHGRPVYVGDNNHLSHLLVQRGLGNVQAVALIWLAALVLGALSLFL